jgi:hypothetical protein
LGLKGKNNIDKAKELEAMGLDEILKLKFKGCKYRSGSIRNWIDGKGNSPKSGSVRKQLQSYVMGQTVQKEILIVREEIPTVQEEIPTVQEKIYKNFRAFVVVIVGSRQILVREMDRHGNWVNEF